MPAAALPPVVARIIQQFQRTESGIVTCRYHRLLKVHAGPSGQTEDFTFDGVYQDGALVAVRMLSYTINGKNASSAQIESAVQSYEHPKPGDVFEAPWRPASAQDYRDVDTGPGAVAFTAIVRSYGHGDGSFTYDTAYNVTSYTYSPTVMPQHARSGTVTGHIAQVLPGYWAMTDESQSYSGSYAIFAAHATLQITQVDFRHFATLSLAQAFIASDHL